MNYATIKKNDIANGPGVRVSLFVSGCRHHCRNCFNREAWDFSFGQPFTDAVMDEILAALAPDYVAGLSFLGGEPFEPENQEGLLTLARRFKERFPEKNLWCYTGFSFEQDLCLLYTSSNLGLAGRTPERLSQGGLRSCVALFVFNCERTGNEIFLTDFYFSLAISSRISRSLSLKSNLLL